MTDPNLLRKDRQDEARRQQETDEKVRELEKEIDRLRDAIRRVRSYNADIRDGKINYRPQDHIDVLDNALNGGGGSDE